MSYAAQHIKHSFSRIQDELMPMTGVKSEIVTTKDQIKSNSLPRLKVRIFSKSVVGFYSSFPVSLRGESLHS